eukprot:6854887-Pyramimonas_sp.AAC.1
MRASRLAQRSVQDPPLLALSQMCYDAHPFLSQSQAHQPMLGHHNVSVQKCVYQRTKSNVPGDPSGNIILQTP